MSFFKPAGAWRWLHLALLLAATAVQAQIAPVAARPAPGNSVRLYVLDCGLLLYNDLQRFGYKRGEIKNTNLANACYLIVHPTKGTMVWDTGVIPDSLWAADGLPPKKLYGEATERLDAQLAQLGYRPEDITYAAVSHAHWDHVANLYQFAKSTWLTSEATRASLLSSTPPNQTDASMFVPLATAKFVATPPDKDFDVFGDGSVTIVPTPGHTADSAVLLVRLARTGPVVLSGDLYHFTNDLERRPILRNENRDLLIAARAKVTALLNDERGTLWIAHDPVVFGSMRRIPQYYD